MPEICSNLNMTAFRKTFQPPSIANTSDIMLCLDADIMKYKTSKYVLSFESEALKQIQISYEKDFLSSYIVLSPPRISTKFI